MVGKKYWYVMYIAYQYFTLDTNIKFASTGDRLLTGGDSTKRAIETAFTVSSVC